MARLSAEGLDRARTRGDGAPRAGAPRLGDLSPPNPRLHTGCGHLPWLRWLGPDPPEWGAFSEKNYQEDILNLKGSP